jgi:hypothetical protein
MAQIYPAHEFDLAEDTPDAEKKLYKALKELPDDWFVFHSYKYVKRNSSKGLSFYENDFLIANMLYGVMVLEVKGGKIYWKEGLMHQVNTSTGADTTVKEHSDPLSQANGGLYDIRDRIKEEMPELIDKVARTPAVAFPACTGYGSMNLPDDYQKIKETIILYQDLDYHFKDKLISIFNFYNSVNLTSMSLEQFERFKKLIAPLCGLIVSAQSVKKDADNAFIRLTNEQTYLLDYLSEQKYAAIQGPAGTGKTMVALEAAKRLADQGRKVLFLCFNELLCQHFREDCVHSGVSYFNITAFVVSLVKGLDVFDAKKRAKVLAGIDPDRLDYDDVIIDEAQDLEDEEIQYFKDYSILKEGTLLLFYDQNQIVLGREVPKWIPASECRLLLKRNCRNTANIAKTSASVIDIPFIQMPNSIVGSQTSIVFAKEDPKVELSRVIKMLISDKNAFKLNEITVLTLRSEKESFLFGVKSLFGVLVSTKQDGQSVFFTTAKRFKGLESEAVIIIDVNESDFLDDQNKRTFYVACSRAKQKLCLLMPGDSASLGKIAAATKSAGFSSEAKILNKTMSKLVDSKVPQPL